MADTKTEVTVYRGPERAGLTAPGEPITARNAPAIVKAAGRRGYVHLNTSHDTSELACDSLCPSLTPGGPATSSKRSRSGCGPPGPALAGPGEWGYAPHTLPERPARESPGTRARPGCGCWGRSWRIGCACAGGRPRPKAGGPRMLPGPAPPAPGQRDSLKSVGQDTRIAQRLSWFLGLQVPLPEVCQG